MFSFNRSIRTIPEPAIHGPLPQDSYPLIDSTNCRSLLNVTVFVTRWKLRVNLNREDQVLLIELANSNNIRFVS
jgi:hypothetical protein